MWKQLINEYGKNRTPFLFIIDFECVRPVVVPLAGIAPEEILFDFNGFTNCDPDRGTSGEAPILRMSPPPFDVYMRAFDLVRKNQEEGNSYLLNLTFPTGVETGLPLRELFHRCRARYRLWYRDEFLVFSPETFVTIADGIIAAHPMKGTIDASIPGAREIILADEKEAAEHVTVVDLLRNDLNGVARDVTVERYRYVERVNSNRKDLLQVSSKISGKLPADYPERLGDILGALLPAGSVTGAPKKKTVEIIREAEGEDRGYYCGVCGYSDGRTLDSGVMIRFLERRSGALRYRSGGGITVYSDVHSEYGELIDKVYVPAS